MVFPSFAPDEDYEERLRLAAGRTLRVIPPDEQLAELHAAEMCDVVLAIDPRYWRQDGWDLTGLCHTQSDGGGTVHLVAAHVGEDTPRERVMFDAHGRVRRVQRLYERSACPEVESVVVPVAVVPQVAVERGHLFPLTDLRVRLATVGIPNRDVQLDTSVLDLGLPGDLLGACRSEVTRVAEAEPVPDGFSRLDAGVLIEEGAVVPASARLLGPLVVHRGVTIGERVTVIGAGAVGAGATIGDDSIVAQSVVLDGAGIQAETQVRNAVAVDDGVVSAGNGAPAAQPTGGRMTVNSMTTTGRRAPRRPARRPIYPLVKRAIDFTAALVLLALLLPLLPVVAVLIKLAAPGPVFFAHRREGVGGREFGCIKFRTMRTDADQMQRTLALVNKVDGPQFKIDNDPRITRVGKWLRLTNLDELPQLINVLLGSMSLVGPRPSPFRENQICAPWRRARLSVPPGITGLWQVCRADRDEGDFHQWIYYDVLYVRHFSFWLDLKILWATMASFGGHRRIPLSRIVSRAAIDHGAEDLSVPMPT